MSGLNGQFNARLQRLEKKAAEGGGGGGSSDIGYYNTSELLTSPVTVPDMTTGGVIAFTDPNALALVNGQETGIYVTDRPLPLIYEDSDSGIIALPKYINEAVEPFIIHFDNPTKVPMFYIRSITDNAKNFVLSNGEDLYIFYNISDVDIVYGYTDQ